MEYLNAAVTLKSLIKETNATLLNNSKKTAESPNQMMIKTAKQDNQNIVMDTFSNEFVTSTLNETDSHAFVITDLSSMDTKGTVLTYLLYKGYHHKMEKGMVYFQVVNKDTLEPIGELQFSNTEDNIFYNVATSEVEASSCNAMETDKKIKDGKSIVFLIGHIDEDRLVYDIERLIIDTLHNVAKHTKLTFNFIVHIARFGGDPSHKLRAKIIAIEAFIKKHIYPEYPNSTFEFVYEKDGSLG